MAGYLPTLRAYVNPLQIYLDTTYTYLKTHPKYVIGYGSGNAQIIKGRYLFGGLRDLRGTIIGTYTNRDLLSHINSISKTDQSYLLASIRSWFIGSTKNLQISIHGWQYNNLASKIDTHSASNLTFLIKGIARVNQLFPSYIHSWQQSNLGMVLGGSHDPVSLSGKIRVQQRKYASLSTLIYAWHIRTLTSSLNIVFPYDLQSTLYPIPPSNLSGYIKVRLQISLHAYARGWQDSYLGANIHQIWAKSLSASAYGRTDMKKNLRAGIKGYSSEYRELSGAIRAFHYMSLGAILRATYLSNIHAYVYAVVPKDLSGKVHAWHERFLQGILNVQNYPWNLTAQIYSKGDWFDFSASIEPRQGVNYYSNLTMSIHPWELRMFSAYIFGSGAPTLSAFLNPLGYAHDLHASIRPKMIRLTTIINIPTQPHRDLSATINYPCFRTGYGDLPSNIYTKYKSDLSAYIKGLCFNYKPKSLLAKVGYTDSYLEVDKLRLSINIYPSEFFTEDKFKLLLRLLDAETLLTAYIRGTLRYNSISAHITCNSIPSYIFDTTLKNREVVINKTYDGLFKEFETVEMAFKSAVEEYFFSSDGKLVWKSMRFDRWMFDIRAILPPDISLGTIRRLHRATTVYDLKKFNSVDEAIRAAIAYVTEHPQSTLGASIVNLGAYRMLSSVIIPRYIVKERTSLESTIIPIGATILVNEKDTISKI